MCMRRAIVAALCMLPLTAAMACGPDFPQRLLDDRKSSLLSLPEGTFAFEAANLLPHTEDPLRAVEDSPWGDSDQTREHVETIGLSADEVKRVRAMRAAPD